MPDGYAHMRAYRQMEINGEPVMFTSGFEDLHIRSYEEILAGRGYKMEEAIPSIELVHAIRTQVPVGLKTEYHPMAK